MQQKIANWVFTKAKNLSWCQQSKFCAKLYLHSFQGGAEPSDEGAGCKRLQSCSRPCELHSATSSQQHLLNLKFQDSVLLFSSALATLSMSIDPESARLECRAEAKPWSQGEQMGKALREQGQVIIVTLGTSVNPTKSCVPADRADRVTWILRWLAARPRAPPRVQRSQRPLLHCQLQL